MCSTGAFYMIIVAITVCLMILLGIAENRLHRRALQKIPLRILVNGTRGKTTVVRMIASTLSAAGMKTYAKTTGSQARWILPDASEVDYRKGRPANILEQLSFVRLAAKEGAEAIVVECMALRPENQFLMAEKLVQPQYVVMTNVFVDHVEEIGATREETVQVLAGSIPEGAAVIGHDESFRPYAGRLIVPTQSPDMEAFAGCAFSVHEENVRLVLALADALGIARETAVRGIRQTKPDIGMYKGFRVGRCRVHNAFAANDPASFLAALDDCARQGPYRLLFNNRSDRGYRLKAFARAIADCAAPPLEIGVIGDDKRWAARYMGRVTGLPAAAVPDAPAYVRALGARDGENRLLCAGNIRGEGQQLLEVLIKDAQTYV